MIILRDYQKIFYNKIINALKTNNKVCAALATGGGKSVIIGKLASDLPGRTLVLTHRVEILQQNSEWLKDGAVLTSKENTLKLSSKVVIAMVQTLYSRIEGFGIDYIGQFDNIILDEIHIDIFEKVFVRYKYKKLIGFTGTPVLNKKKYFELNGLEYVEPLTLSETFEVLVCGPTTRQLIELGYLVRDHNIVLDLPDFDKLRESERQPDGYTTKSLNDVYTNSASFNILRKAYAEHCNGKKTLIFNASNKISKFVYDRFKKLGLNVKIYDTSGNSSINSKTGKKYTREEIVEWFKSERNAILVNTNVFTTGFNVTDVECVIVNRATKSLSLWIQMVGRGSRTTDRIFKDHFTVIDLGQNIYTHGIWSADRNWHDYFESPGPKLKQVNDMLDTWTCNNCGYINMKTDLNCISCGLSYKDANPVEIKKKKMKEGDLRVLGDLPPPRGNFIVEYAKARNEDTAFAYNLAERKIIELFQYYKVTPDFYKSKKDEFDKRVEDIFRPIYFAISRSKLPGNKRRKLSTFTNRIIDKVEKLMKYEAPKN